MNEISKIIADTIIFDIHDYHKIEGYNIAGMGIKKGLIPSGAIKELLKKGFTVQFLDGELRIWIKKGSPTLEGMPV